MEVRNNIRLKNYKGLLEISPISKMVFGICKYIYDQMTMDLNAGPDGLVDVSWLYTYIYIYICTI